jgi:hypothetical protein
MKSFGSSINSSAVKALTQEASGDEIKQDSPDAFDQRMRALEPEADFENLMDAVFIDGLQKSASRSIMETDAKWMQL